MTMNSRELISLVENGRSGLSPAKLFTASEHLNVSMDYLFGLTEAPTPAQELTLELKTSAARMRDLEQMQDQEKPRDDADYMGVCEVTTAAGTVVCLFYPQAIGGQLLFCFAYVKLQISSA